MPDYFTIFSLPLHLHIDTAALERSFYAQSRKLHPDRFASRPLPEQEAALAESSRLNDAYRTLKDPILRTQYLLTLEGVALEEQSKAATEHARTSGEQKKQLIPPELLEALWTRWDVAVNAGDAPARTLARDAMVALLNKRSYLRNLVRDVNQALEPAF